MYILFLQIAINLSYEIYFKNCMVIILLKIFNICKLLIVISSKISIDVNNIRVLLSTCLGYLREEQLCNT